MVMGLASLGNRILSLVVVLTLLMLLNSSVVSLSENNVNIHPSVTVLVYPDASIELVYILSGYLPLELNASSGYIDYVLDYNTGNNTLLLAIVGGGELVYGEPSGAPINYSIVFIGLSTDTHSNLQNKTAQTLGVLIINIDESINGAPSHLTLNTSKIIVDSTPESANLSFVLEIRGSGNLSLLDKLLGYNLSEINNMLTLKGFDWIKITSYKTALYNNTYRVTGSLTVNLSMLLDKMLNKSILSENQVDKIRACITNLYSNTSIRAKLAQAYGSEEYSSARRIILKTEFNLALRGDTSVLDNMTSCFPVYAKLLSLMSPGSPNITIPRIDFNKYTRIPGLTRSQPYPLHINFRLNVIRTGVKFNLTIDSGRLIYNATGLPLNMKAEKALEVIKDYLENLTALLAPYNIMLGAEHLVPTTVNVKGVSINEFKVIVEPETMELFKPVRLNVSITRTPSTTRTTTAETKPTETFTRTITMTKTLEENFTIIRTIEHTTTITKPTTIRETITNTIRAIDTRALIASIIITATVSVLTTYIMMKRRSR